MTPRTKGKAPRSPSSSTAGKVREALWAPRPAARLCPEGRPQTRAAPEGSPGLPAMTSRPESLSPRLQAGLSGRVLRRDDRLGPGALGAKCPARRERCGVQVEGEAQGHLWPGRAVGTQRG